MSVNLYAGDTTPFHGYEFVNGDIAPFVISKPCDIAKGDMRLGIVFGDVPIGRSSDIKEGGVNAWVFLVLLAVKVIAFGQSCEGLEKFCLGHKNEGLRNRRGLLAVRVNEKSKEELARGKSLSF